MYYPEELIEEVRTRNDIVEVISGYVRLQKKGSNYFGLCPFHNEKSPSFSVSPGKQMYYCFGCGAGGNVITFLMEYENQTFPEAVRTLAQRAGIALPEADDSKEARQADSRRAKLLEINKEAAKYFYYQLRTERGSVGMEYLRKRELSDETMNHFGLGYANKYSNDLIQYLKSKGYSEDLIRDAGLCNVDEKHGMYDKFWNRVMFPIQDINHRVIGFGGRVMGDGKPKYLNSPETEIFDKSRNLYGLNFARTSRKGNVILCEGYMDVIAMHQAGFTNAVATLGTALTEEQSRLIAQYTGEVVLSYDSDAPGQAATRRATGLLEAAGVKIRVLSIPDAKDPDEFIKKFGAERFAQLIEGSSSATDFAINKLRQENDVTTAEGKVSFLKQFAALMAGLPNPIEREVYLSKVCRELEVDKAAVAGQIAREQKRRDYRDRKKEERDLIAPPIREDSGKDREDELLLRQHPREMKAAERLLRYLLRNPDRAEALRDRLPEGYFLSENDRTMYRVLLQRGLSGQELDISALGENLSPQAVDRLAKWQLPGAPPVTDEEAEDCLKCLRDYAARMSRDELGQLSGEALRQYIENLNREKNRRKE